MTASVVLAGDGPVTALLADAACGLGIGWRSLTRERPEPQVTGAGQAPQVPTPVVMGDLGSAAQWLATFSGDDAPQGVSVVPPLPLLDALWSGCTPQSAWLRSQGLPACPDASPAAGHPVAGDRPGSGAHFILPLVCDRRGNQVLLPMFAPEYDGAPAGGPLRRVHCRLPEGARRRCLAIAGCLGDRLTTVAAAPGTPSTPGVIGIGFRCAPADSVHIERIWSFADLANAMPGPLARQSLARVHLAAVLGLPLPDFAGD